MVKQQTLAVSAHKYTEKLAKSNGELSQSLHIGTARNRQCHMANSRSLRPLAQGEIGNVKRRTLPVSAHGDTEKFAKSNSELSQPPLITDKFLKSNGELSKSPLIGTTRNWQSQTANSRCLCSLGHREIGKVLR